MHTVCLGKDLGSFMDSANCLAPPVLFFSTLTLSCWAVARKREAEKRAHVTEGRSLMLLLVCVWLWWVGVVHGVRQDERVRTNPEVEQRAHVLLSRVTLLLPPRHQQK